MMIILSNEQLIDIKGGISISGTMISAVTRAISVILDVGRSLGTSISRISKGKICY